MHWHAEHSFETDAPPAAIWALMCDVNSWPSWNAGIEYITLDGPFASGSWFAMKVPGQNELRSQLIDVSAPRGFTDETCVGPLVVTVEHRIERTAAGATRIVYRLDAQGPDAEQIGPAIASDFPEVLAALAGAALVNVS